jgi:hypothetical protein
VVIGSRCGSHADGRGDGGGGIQGWHGHHDRETEAVPRSLEMRLHDDVDRTGFSASAKVP